MLIRPVRSFSPAVSHCRLIAAIAIATLPLHTTAAELTPAELAKGARALQSQVRSFNVTLNGESQVRPFDAKSVSDKLSQPAATTIVYSWDQTGRFSYDIHGTGVKSDGSLTRQLFWKGAYNGKSHKEYGGEGGVPTEGWLSSTPRSVPIACDPRDIFFTYIGGNLADVLANPQNEVTPSKDDSVTILTPDTLGEDKVRRRYRLHMAPAQGFATIKREALQFVPARNTWLPYNEQVFSDYKLTEDGIWAPSHASNTIYLIEQAADKPSSVMSHAKFKLSNYSFNSAVPASAFDIVFPNKLTITDRNTGKAMLVVDTPGQSPAQAASRGVEIYVQSQNSDRRSRLMMAAGICVVIFIVCFIWYLLRRRAKRPLSSDA